MKTLSFVLAGFGAVLVPGLLTQHMPVDERIGVMVGVYCVVAALMLGVWDRG